MTTFMKFEIVTYYVLKVIGYISGICGAFGTIGFVGGLEQGNSTFGEFLTYEFLALGLIGLCFIVYYIRELIREDLYRRDRCLRHETNY